MNSVRLKDLLLTSVKNGYSPICVDNPTGKWVLGLGALDGSGLDTREVKPVPIDNIKTDPYILEDGDFLISRSNTLDKVGRAALYRGELKNCSYPDLMMRFRVNEAIIFPDFLEEYLQSNIARKHFMSCAAGTSGSMVKITKSVVEKLIINLPSLVDQKAIAQIAASCTAVIEKTEALIDAKERQFGWLKSKLIGQQNAYTTKLGDHFGKSIVIEKGKPLIKANIAENGNIPVIAGGKSSPYSHDQLTHSVPCITISASGAYAGYVWYHDYPIWASDCNVIYSTEHSTEYLYFALKMKQSRIYAFQSGGGQPHVYARDLKNISIPLPPLDEQKSIAHTLNTARCEITLLKKLADQYRTQKRGLMQKLLSGEWPIKNKEAA